MAIRTIVYKEINHIELLKKQLMQWSDTAKTVCILDSNLHKEKYSSFDFLVALDTETTIELDNTTQAFEQLKNYYDTCNDTIFGVLSYDLKNDIEKLSSDNTDVVAFPALYFFQAKKLFIIKNNTLKISYLNKYKNEIAGDYDAITNTIIKTNKTNKKLKIEATISKTTYLDTINHIKTDIQQGKYYELNYCQPYTYDVETIDSLKTYQALNRISKAPFANYFKHNEYHLLGSSPERFIKKTKQYLISQPIKGTAKRGKTIQEDKAIIKLLKNDKKERAENIMIVDLVRNDMAKIALKNTVTVSELCQIYTFDQVHQMISTVQCELANTIHPIDTIKALFPMGSMTGAPKVAAMQHIEKYEQFKRGFYSGALGYITADGDFDFNVIIRSILYNASLKKLSFAVGGAITNQSDAEKEYVECLTKAKAMFEVLENQAE